MERADVVVRLPQPGQDRVRVGTVVVGGRSPVRVRWEDDGSEEDVTLDNRDRLAARDSLRYEWLLDPSAVGERVRADPVAAFVRLIHDGPAQTAQELQALLQTYGVDAAAAKDSWQRFSKTIGKRVDIARDSSRRYVSRPAPRGPGGTKGVASGTAPSAGPAVTPAPDDTVTPLPDDTGVPPVDDAGVPSAGRRSEPVSPAAVAVGADAGAAPRDAGADLAAGLAADPPAGPAVRVAAPRPAEAVADRPAPAVADPPSGAAGGTADAAVTSLAHVIRGLSVDADPAAVDGAARLMADLMSRGPAAEVRAVQPAVLAAAVADLPLRPGGGRAAVVAVAARLWPAGVAERTWWRGASLDDLVACAEHGLGGVTDLPAVGERIIRPLVLAALDAAATRRELSRLLGLPEEFARQLPGDAVAGAWRRIGRDDPTLAGWHEVLAGGAGPR